MNPSVARRTFLTRVLLAAGLVLFAALVWRVGPESIARELARAGWFIPLVFIPHALVAVGEAVGWWYAFPDKTNPPPFSLVGRFTVAAKAIQLVTPSMAQVGELTRVQLLRSAEVGTDVAIASVIAAKMAMMLGEVAFMALGLAAASSVVALDSSVALTVGVGILVMLAAIAALWIWQRVGLLSPIIWISRQLNVFADFFERHKEVLSSTEILLQTYLSKRSKFLKSCTASFLAWLAGVIEAWAFLAVLGLPGDLWAALIIQAWLIIVIRLTAFVPANLGTQEAGAVMIFAVLGLPAEGAMAFALLRRIRQIGWVAAGLTLLARQPGARNASQLG